MKRFAFGLRSIVVIAVALIHFNANFAQAGFLYGVKATRTARIVSLDLDTNQTAIRTAGIANIFDNLGGLAFDPGNENPLIPEPSSLTLLGIGAVSLFGYGWRRKRMLAA